MTTPRFYKPARGIHRSLTCIALALVVSIVGAPFAGVTGNELVGWVFIALCAALFIALIKMGIHLRNHYKRDTVLAGRHNQEVLLEFVQQHPDMKKLRSKVVKNAQALTWGDCIRFRKEVNAALVSRRADSLLAGLERLGII